MAVRLVVEWSGPCPASCFPWVLQQVAACKTRVTGHEVDGHCARIVEVRERRCGILPADSMRVAIEGRAIAQADGEDPQAGRQQ